MEIHLLTHKDSTLQEVGKLPFFGVNVKASTHDSGAYITLQNGQDPT